MAPQTQLSTQAAAHALALKVKEPIIGGSTLHLSSSDGLWGMILPKDAFPFCEEGDIVFVTLGVVKTSVTPIDPTAPSSALILPSSATAQ